mgnify:CR=1 FL=1
MRKRYLILVMLFCTSCSNKIEKFTPCDPTGISIKILCDNNKYLKNEDILLKLYYSHNMKEITKTNNICEFKLLFIDNDEKKELFNNTQYGSEFFTEKNYSESTSNFFFFAKPTYNSYFEVNLNFNDVENGDYILKYTLDIKDELGNYSILSYYVELSLEIDDEIICINK